MSRRLHDNAPHVIVFFGGLALLLTLQFLGRPQARDGLYFNGFSSESMMQTVSLIDLKTEPIRSLFYLHIQPPALDTIRAIAVALQSSESELELLRRTDRSLYFLWALFYSMAGVLIYAWMRRLTSSSVALLTWFVFALHPASIYYATFLEASFLTSALVLWMYFELWKLGQDDRRRIGRFTVAVLALFFTRSLFQWQVLLALAGSLALLRVPRKKILTYLMIVGATAGIYLMKQQLLFGIWTTSSFTGYNLCRSVDHFVEYYEYADDPSFSAPPAPSEPRVLSRVRKLDGSINLNHRGYLDVNRQLIGEFAEVAASLPLTNLVHLNVEKFSIYWRPSSQYTPHAIVDRLPWRTTFDAVFSKPALPLLLLAALVSNLARTKDRRATLGLLLPACVISFISIVGEYGENMRFRYFLEPVMLVFVASELYAWMPSQLNRFTKRTLRHGANTLRPSFRRKAMSVHASCSKCGKPATTCEHCGGPLKVDCGACGATLDGGAHFCSACGTPVGAPPPTRRSAGLAWVALGIAAVALVLVIVARFGPTPAPPPDLTGMEPRKAADLVFNRMMAAHGRGDFKSMSKLKPMAVESFAAVTALDNGARYQLGLLHALTGTPAEAQLQVDFLLAGESNHLLAIMLQSALARANRNEPGQTAAWRQFLEAYPVEIATGKQEYIDHRQAIEEFLVAASGELQGGAD